MADNPIPPRPSATSPLSSIKYLPTNEAYARWASTYDTDGNPLQALDDLELHSLLPKFLSLFTATPKPGTPIDPSTSAPAATPPLLVDLGCGTGRNTAKLLSLSSAHVVGLDSSPEMLSVAEQRCNSLLPSLQPTQRVASVKFGVYDLLSESALEKLLSTETQGTADIPVPRPDAPVWAGLAGTADGIISTLVIEHIPLETYFKAVAALLRPGGYALITNMHADMGAVSQAGFKDESTGEKVRPVSYAHKTDDVISAAKTQGLAIVYVDGDGMRERSVTEDLANGALKESRAKKWIGTKIWFGVVLKKEA